MKNGTSWEKKEGVCLDEEKEDHGDQKIMGINGIT